MAIDLSWIILDFVHEDDFVFGSEEKLMERGRDERGNTKLNAFWTHLLGANQTLSNQLKATWDTCPLRLAWSR